MSTPQSEVNQELFRRVNALEQVYSETTGYLKGIVESNEKLIKLFSRALYILAAIAFLSLFALIYGAIGERGLKSVRESVPSIPMRQTAALPAHNDFDKWKRKMSADTPFC